MRGGTSKALMLHARDLPPDQAEWTPLLTAAMGTPDPYGRQLGACISNALPNDRVGC